MENTSPPDQPPHLTTTPEAIAGLSRQRRACRETTAIRDRPPLDQDWGLGKLIEIECGTEDDPERTSILVPETFLKEYFPQLTRVAADSVSVDTVDDMLNICRHAVESMNLAYTIVKPSSPTDQAKAISDFKDMQRSFQRSQTPYIRFPGKPEAVKCLFEEIILRDNNTYSHIKPAPKLSQAEAFERDIRTYTLLLPHTYGDVLNGINPLTGKATRKTTLLQTWTMHKFVVSGLRYDEIPIQAIQAHIKAGFLQIDDIEKETIDGIKKETKDVALDAIVDSIIGAHDEQGPLTLEKVYTLRDRLLKDSAGADLTGAVADYLTREKFKNAFEDMEASD